MALRTPPSWLQNGSHPAENDRLTAQGILSATGVLGANSLFVSATGASMGLSIAPGWASILSSTSAAGVYSIYNDAATTVTVGAADVTNPRIDRVVATVNDSYYSGSLNNVIFQIIQGTAAASPTAPAIPSNSISLALVSVAANATTISQGNLTDTRISVPLTFSPTSAYTSLSAARTLTAASTIDQSVFNLSLTLQPNTLYEYEAVFTLNMTTTTAAAVSIKAGASISASVSATDGFAYAGTLSGTTTQGFSNLLSGSGPLYGTVYTSPAVAATYSIPIVVKGTIRTSTTSGSTFAPFVSLLQTTTSSVTVSRGSYVKVNALGPATALNVGAWA